MALKNSKGTVWYGLHFYPGVAEYAEPDGSSYRVFLNENTLRLMDPTFAGRPVFVEHVDGVSESLEALKEEADGWVLESFFNQADGKHWVKFLTVSAKAEQAIKQGWQLSNCYAPTGFASGGMWNGVTYAKEIVGGEYEHLAIVPNPRYEESVIMTPDQFKKYNEDKTLELKRLANEKEKDTMKLNIFKRTKVENATDLEGLMVQLPESGREVALTTLVSEADAAEKSKGAPRVANKSDTVTIKNGEKMTVGDLVAKHQAMYDEIEEMKKKNVSFEVDHDEAGEVDHELENDDEDGDGDGDGDEDDKKKRNKKKANKEAEDDRRDNEDMDMEDKQTKKNAAKEKADRLRNADKARHEQVVISLPEDRIARGKARYGS